MVIKVGMVAFAIAILTVFLSISTTAQSQKLNRTIERTLRPSLNLVYPSDRTKTKSDRIFFIGNAPSSGKVFLNGRSVRQSKSGNFAPSLPLQLGQNQVTLNYKGEGKSEKLSLKIERLAIAPQLPTDLAFMSDSLYPALNIARPIAEKICFGAIATARSEVNVKVRERLISLTEVENNQRLPQNSAILTGDNQPNSSNSLSEHPGNYQGCTAFDQPFAATEVIYTVKNSTIQNQNSKSLIANGRLEILAKETEQVAEVIVDNAIARTGAGSDFSRLTPLPKGTQASVTAKEGEWLRLDYGGWVEAKSLKIKNSNVLPRSLVRSLSTRQLKEQNGDWTELIIPLQVPVPISIWQSDRFLRLILHNVTAQTDTILVNADSVIETLNWQQLDPTKVQYEIVLKSSQQWGYKVRYQGTSLILSLRHPPQLSKNSSPKEKLKNLSILLDPGHGSAEDLGSRGGTGYPEKDVTLIISKLLATELQQFGVKVNFTRTDDQDILPGARANLIEQQQPNLALSLHYNALPDQGDAENTEGIGMFWYHSQSQPLAQFLHDYLTTKLGRKSYGVFWNNLALTRPTIAPSILLELGFMTHPQEFEWITDAIAQKKLAKTLAEAIYTWLQMTTTNNL